MFLDAAKIITAASKNSSLNLSLFIFFQMSYNLFKVWGFRPSPYLRAVMRLARPAMNVPAAIRILAIYFASFRLFFFLLICISPPYDYIILYGVPYVNKKVEIFLFSAEFRDFFHLSFVLCNSFF